jgi:hypothetical protein
VRPLRCLLTPFPMAGLSGGSANIGWLRELMLRTTWLQAARNRAEKTQQLRFVRAVSTVNGTAPPEAGHSPSIGSHFLRNSTTFVSTTAAPEPDIM